MPPGAGSVQGQGLGLSEYANMQGVRAYGVYWAPVEGCYLSSTIGIYSKEFPYYSTLN